MSRSTNLEAVLFTSLHEHGACHRLTQAKQAAKAKPGAAAPCELFRGDAVCPVQTGKLTPCWNRPAQEAPEQPTTSVWVVRDLHSL